MKWKLLSTSPTTAVKPYKVDDTRVRTLSEEELQKVLTETPSDVALWCHVTLECLLRISEVLQICREHIGTSWVEVRRKGGRVDRVGITDDLRASLVKRIHKRGYVFGREPVGDPPTQESASLQVCRAMKALGLSGVSHHTMRHTGVTLMLEAGINPRAIQRLAGWTSLRMLERYGHVRDAELQRAVAATAAVIERAQTRAQQPNAVSDESPQVVDEHWRPQRDSNPCFGLERATSWASGRWGRLR